MRKDLIGFEIAPLKEGQKIVHIPMDDELKKDIKELIGKSPYEYLEEFFIDKKLFDEYYSDFKERSKKSLPDKIGENCLRCDGDHNVLNENERGNCERFHLQINLTFLVASAEFVNIVLNNRMIYENKNYLVELTKKFFSCLYFVNGEGKMYFNLDKICRYAIDTGFKNIAEILSKSETLSNLQIINDTIDKLEQQEIENKVLEKEDENYIGLQKEFFESKRKYYKEKLLLEKEQPKISFGKKIKEKIPLPKTVLYYYYLQQTGVYPFFENHPEGKVKAIEELIYRDKIKTTVKHFQLKYNFISNYKTNRIASNQVANIDYVANKMLKNYPHAKELALSELKLAQTKQR